MLEYYVLLKQRYPDRPIRQMVLFAGEGNPRMENELRDCGIVYTYEIKSMKEIKCRELMDSEKMEDKILAVLCNVEDFESYILKLSEELMEYPEKVRQDYLEKLSIALKYRPKLKLELKRILEEKKLPLTITEEMIKQDPFFREGLERGKKEGLKEGVEKGIEKGKKEVIQKIYQKGILSPEEIADLLELPLEFVKEAIAELQKGKEEK
jgi:predicted transposase YdaD